MQASSLSPSSPLLSLTSTVTETDTDTMVQVTTKAKKKVPTTSKTTSNGNAGANTSFTRQRTLRGISFAHYYWTWHFLVTFVVVVLGILYNRGTQKYTPVPVQEDSSCTKLFVNVLASSADSSGAIVCCEEEGVSSGGGLCQTSYPPLYKQLTRLPGAIWIPLVPFVVGAITVNWEAFVSGIPTERLHTTLSRLLLYVLVLMFRTYVLYVGATKMQRLLFPSHELCWYHEMANNRKGCQSQAFDFSDHTVLFLGQILAIPLFEMLHLFTTHHWSRAWKGVFTGLCCFMIYLYLITLYGQFKTAAYFHTGLEVLIGYIFSLMTQLPMAWIQSTPHLDSLRVAIFGHSLLRD